MRPAKGSSKFLKSTETLIEKHQRLLKRQARVISGLTGKVAPSTTSQASIAAAKAQRVVAKKAISKASVQELAKRVGIWNDSGKLTSSYKK